MHSTCLLELKDTINISPLFVYITQGTFKVHLQAFSGVFNRISLSKLNGKAAKAPERKEN